MSCLGSDFVGMSTLPSFLCYKICYLETGTELSWQQTTHSITSYMAMRAESLPSGHENAYWNRCLLQRTNCCLFHDGRHPLERVQYDQFARRWVSDPHWRINHWRIVEHRLGFCFFKFGIIYGSKPDFHEDKSCLLSSYLICQILLPQSLCT